MFDVHYHLIFGVDDGPKTLESSLELAQASIAQGVTHIVATPHASARYPYQRQVNEDRLKILQDHFGDSITLGLGCDFHLSYDNLEEFEREPTGFTINRSKYLLVEFPDFVNIGVYNDVFFRIMAAGVIPIITHPERNPSLITNPTPLVDWVHMGCLLQITAASLWGHFGKSPQSLCRRLIQANYVHLIASDAHNLGGRPPAMARGFEHLAKTYGQETAERLCIDNPRAMFYGEPLSPQPEPSKSLNGGKFAYGGFLGRWFGR
ncbi:MAG TPA: CpsB/CapC family capsule biosynthesis tyrosine phosphatase [Terracidiphilus sp.]|jgi:protein-tyrosine phosphatase|nr:CpsB/CapC family capsule biosynthesis tyrosine phosphatase [Terracidiphilus sp.]